MNIFKFIFYFIIVAIIIITIFTDTFLVLIPLFILVGIDNLIKFVKNAKFLDIYNKDRRGK